MDALKLEVLRNVLVKGADDDVDEIMRAVAPNESNWRDIEADKALFNTVWQRTDDNTLQDIYPRYHLIKSINAAIAGYDRKDMSGMVLAVQRSGRMYWAGFVPVEDARGFDCAHPADAVIESANIAMLGQ
ncbi:hypothetical protein DWF04_013485 [Cereibacter sphaeroides f. sp. denitrificans]